MTKQAQLNTLKESILKENICSDMAVNATQLVFGSGNVESDIVFVGEAPGKREDLSGEPFVGTSGKLLDELLGSININRKDVYVTNIVKYRPVGNRDPSTEEKTEFWPFLLRQLAIIKPKIVATLGRHSGQAFLPSLRISADHGQISNVLINVDGKKEDLLLLPLYHPAAALYNGSLRKTLFEDFQSITRILKKS